jgi:hypothetical protein
VTFPRPSHVEADELVFLQNLLTDNIVDQAVMEQKRSRMDWMKTMHRRSANRSHASLVAALARKANKGQLLVRSTANCGKRHA